MSNLAKLRVPTSTQTAADWCVDNKLSFNATDYRQVCNELGVHCHKTQSGKVALTQAIMQARKRNGVAVEASSSSTSSENSSHTQTHTDMQTHTQAVPATTDQAVTAANLMQQAISLLGVAGSSSNELSEAQITQVLDLIGKHSHTSTRLVVENAEAGTSKDVGVHHNELPRLIRLASTREHLYLHGPAGTGKSHLAWQIAEALDLPFACMSFCGQSTKSDLLGYMDAHGNYIATPFYEIYKNGGVFCLDEMDAANPNLINLLNGGLAGKMMSFPCGMVSRHPDFICVASANTFGTGSTEQYIGRNPLDAASLDRFQKITIDYCTKLERSLYSESACQMVWAERKRLEGRTGFVLSMRTINRIEKYLAMGMSESEVYSLAIEAHLNKNLRK